MSDETEIYCETPSGGRYRLNLFFPEGRGSVESMPRCSGVYAEIHRPTNYIRIGSAQEMKVRNKQHIAWAEKHKNGTHTKQSEVNRKGPIVDVAKEHGASGLEYYVVCSDPGMADMAERQAVENFMHDWCRRQTKYLDMNGEAKHKHLHAGTSECNSPTCSMYLGDDFLTDPPIIDVWDLNTFDEDLCSALKDQTDLIRGYFLREREISASYRLAQGSDRPLCRPPNPFEAEFIKMQKKLSPLMAKRVIRAFHYTRMTEREVAQACDNGLYLSTFDSLRQRLQALVETGDLTSNDVRVLEAASPFNSQLENRQNMFWMTSHPIPIEDSRVERLLRYWGGEVASFRLDDESLLAKLEKIGCPRIVEIAVPPSETYEGYHSDAAEVAVAAFGRSLDCCEWQKEFDLCAKMALQATAILRVHSAGEEEFEGMGKTYPSNIHRECPAQF